jgi:hypothetical protein
MNANEYHVKRYQKELRAELRRQKLCRLTLEILGLGVLLAGVFVSGKMVLT